MTAHRLSAEELKGEKEWFYDDDHGQALLDHIEALETELTEWSEAASALRTALYAAQDERERLRGENERLRVASRLQST